MKTLLIIGAGGHGGTVADAAMRNGRWEHIEFYDDRAIVGSQLYGVTVRGTVSDLVDRSFAVDGESEVFVAIGNNARRLELLRQVLNAGASLATVVHSAAVVGSGVSIGAGTVLMAGAVVNVAAQIGLGCIINTRASVDHDCVIGDGAHICPGATLAGNVTVGELAWVGIGSCVIQGCNIGARVTIGAGSVIIREVQDGMTVVGNPARELRRE